MKNKLFAIAAATTLFANATPVFATTLISDNVIGRVPTCHCCCCTKKTSIDTPDTPYLPYIETVTICDVNAVSSYLREKADIVLQE